MQKKKIALLLVFGIGISLIGCGQAGKGGADKGANKLKNNAKSEKTVTFYSWSTGSEQESDQSMCDQYEKTHPGIKVEANFIPYDEYLSKINTMAAANSMPDVFKMPEGNVLEWGTKGAVLDLKPLYAKAGVDLEKEMIPNAIFQSGDNVWGVGSNVTTLALFYNKKLLKENKIELPSTDVTHPWTWDEFVKNAKKLTKDANGKTPDEKGFDDENVSVYGTMMPTAWNVFMPLMYTNDAGIADQDGKKLLINGDAGTEVLQKIADLSLKEKCAPTVAMTKGSFSDASAMLMNGQLAMMIDGAWALGTYANEGYDVGVAQIPMFKKVANMSWGAGICMSPKDANNKNAFDFLRYYTDFNNAITASAKTGVPLACLPHSIDTLDGGKNEEAWIKTYTKVDESANCKVFKDILQNDGTRLGENVTLKNFPVIVDNTIVPLLDNVWLGETTVKDALASLDVSSDLQGTWN